VLVGDGDDIFEGRAVVGAAPPTFVRIGDLCLRGDRERRTL
jgi:hypothetical protein